ncbi:hypothetical protein [Methylocystis sp. SC2]|uniref:hypothetical protein n=1 Tax=Methylocystis sp. (strain SC2) TaxID=187303 RepID=UPI00027AE74C|nr:hypothetical protein [Methylocystis sp. SC2]CCJ07289.1 Hypothetical protein BN69_1838 [Methylocystis sp. SC2]
MAINRTKAIGDAPAGGPKQSGGRRKSEFLVPRGMTLDERQGKKVAVPPLRLRRSRRSRPSARSSQKRGCNGRVGSDSIVNKEKWRWRKHLRKKFVARGEGKEAIGSKWRGGESPGS